MKQCRLSDEQVHGAVRRMEAGQTADKMGWELGVSKVTLYGWKAEYGGFELSEVKRLRELEAKLPR